MHNFFKFSALALFSFIITSCGASMTPLYQATQTNNTAEVKRLISEGANPDEPGFYGDPAILAAVSANNKQMVNLLLDNGANIDSIGTFTQSTPLTAAILGNKPGMVKLLLDKGADPNLTPSAIGFPPISHAIGASYYNYGYVMEPGTPMPILEINVDTDVLELIVKAGTNLEASANNVPTPLMIASHLNKRDAMEILIASGAKVNKSWYDETALSFAAYQNHRKAMEFLIKKGADVNFVGSSENSSPLVAETLFQKNNDAAEILIKNGADLTLKSRNGYNIATLTVYGDNGDGINMLKENGAKIDAENEDGLTPLHHAVIGNKISALSALIRAGADMDKILYSNKMKANVSPLTFAKKYSNKQTVAMLQQAGAKEFKQKIE